jgi:hypothetical protein
VHVVAVFGPDVSDYPRLLPIETMTGVVIERNLSELKYLSEITLSRLSFRYNRKTEIMLILMKI